MTTTIENPLKVTHKCCFNYTSFETNFWRKKLILSVLIKALNPHYSLIFFYIISYIQLDIIHIAYKQSVETVKTHKLPGASPPWAPPWTYLGPSKGGPRPLAFFGYTSKGPSYASECHNIKNKALEIKRAWHPETIW